MKEIFSPHLSLAKEYWKNHLQPGDSAIDATCGNGHDTLALGEILLSDPRSCIATYDIQTIALQNTEALLSRHLSPDQLKRILFHRCSHAKMGLLPFIPHLIVYNLGYLPGGDKTLTTLTETTLESVKLSWEMLPTGGALSITCYPGHPEGEKEEQAILAWASTLTGSICYHKWINRPRSPTLLWMKRT